MPLIVGKALKEMGLSDKEILVLSALLERGSAPAAAVAKATKLNRTSTYGILKELMGRGLVSSSRKDGVTRWQSIVPELLPAYLQRKREALAENERELQEALPQIKLLRNKGRTLPKIQYFEGVDGLAQAYQDTIDNNRGKVLYALTGLEGAYTKLDPSFVAYYPRERARKGVKAFFITPATDTAKEKAKLDSALLRHSKFIPAQFNFDSEITIYDNKVGIYSHRSENPIALIIEDETIAHAMKQLYRYIESTAQ